MDKLIIPETDFTPGIRFLPDSGQFEIYGVSRPEDVSGFYEDTLQWLARYEESVLKSGNRYELPELNISFRLSYFNSASSKYMIQMLRHIKNLITGGIDVKIDWYYGEGDEKMQEDGEDIAEAVEMEFNFIELED